MRLVQRRDRPRRLRRCGALATTLAAGVLPVPGSASAAPTDDPEARDAAVFIGRQLQAHDHRMPGAAAGPRTGD